MIDQRIFNLDGLHMARSEAAHIALAAGRHAIHIPCYEGKPDSVALVLEVRPPGGDWKIFDLREFAQPDDDLTHSSPSVTPSTPCLETVIQLGCKLVAKA